MIKKTYQELTLTIKEDYEVFLDFLTNDLSCEFEENNNSIIIRHEDNLKNLENLCCEFAKLLSYKTNKPINLETKLVEKENKDWIKTYQNSINSIEIGNINIHPSWEKEKEGKINIKINPSLAFGTGKHETTSSCILLLKKYLKKNHYFLDLGCGSGILSILASKLKAKVDACDLDKLAIKTCKENFKINEEKLNKIWLGSIKNNNYDIIVANIIADVLISLNKDLKNSIKDNGYLILSGILKEYENKVLNNFKDFKIKDKIINEEWLSLVLQKG